jgi:hypothetical protein
MNKEEKLKYIADFENASSMFDDIRSLPDDLILFRPYADSWSIKEQIVHCMEVDLANFHRYRRAIAQPETKIISFSQIWTSALDYQSADLLATIDLIKTVRNYIASHLRTIVDQDWKKYAYAHDKKGRIDLEEALIDYIDHAIFHRNLIDRNISLYEINHN